MINFSRISKIAGLILIVAGINTATFAEKLNVIAPSNETSIKLDGKEIGTGSVFNYDVESGTHYLQMYLKGEIIYQRFLTITKNEPTNIDVSGFLNTPLPNIPLPGSAKLAAERLNETKGSFGIGLQCTSVVSGLSLIYFFDKIGIQLIGWSSEDYKAIEPRILYKITNKLMGNDTIRSLYVGVGSGSAQNKPSLFSSLNADRTVTQTFIGLEFPFSVGLGNGGFGNLEFAYANVDNKDSDSGMKFNLGYHMYF